MCACTVCLKKDEVVLVEETLGVRQDNGNILLLDRGVVFFSSSFFFSAYRKMEQMINNS